MEPRKYRKYYASLLIPYIYTHNNQQEIKGNIRTLITYKNSQ